MKAAAKGVASFGTYQMNNGNYIPCLGLGTYMVTSKEHTSKILLAAYSAGYRLIDTARMYDNEADLGWSLKQLEKAHGISRKEFFVTTKILPGDVSYKGAYKTLKKSLADLQTDYLDLFLIHWPTSDTVGRVGCWKAMQELYEKKVVKNIGVSNFTRKQLEHLRKQPGVYVEPCVNQIETHPLYVDIPTIEYCRSRKILLESYCPLKQNDDFVMKNKILAKIGGRYGKSIPQVVIRWHYQNGFIALPRSNNVKHVAENVDIFDFELSKDEMTQIASLNVMDKTDWDPHSIDQ